MLTKLRDQMNDQAVAVALVDSGNRKLDDLVVQHSQEIQVLMSRTHLPNAPERPL